MKLDQVKSTFGVAASAAVIGLLLYLQKPGPQVDPQQVAHEASLSMNTLQLRNGVIDSSLMLAIHGSRKDYLPVLIKQMGVDESGVKRLLRLTAKQLPPAMRDKVHLDQAPAAYRAGASWGLFLLLRGYDDAFQTVTPDEADLLLPALRSALKDESIPVRLNAVLCLSPFNANSAEAKELCLLALKDKNAGVRYNAVYALWKIFMNEKNLRDFLDDVLQSFDSSARAEAFKNLDRIVQPYSASQSSSAFE